MNQSPMSLKISPDKSQTSGINSNKAGSSSSMTKLIERLQSYLMNLDFNSFLRKKKNYHYRTSTNSEIQKKTSLLSLYLKNKNKITLRPWHNTKNIWINHQTKNLRVWRWKKQWKVKVKIALKDHVMKMNNSS